MSRNIPEPGRMKGNGQEWNRNDTKIYRNETGMHTKLIWSAEPEKDKI